MNPHQKRGGGEVGSPVRDLFGSALKLLPVEILLNIFCPVAVDFSPEEDQFWCSLPVRKCSKVGKNRKQIKWLLVVLPKIFRIR